MLFSVNALRLVIAICIALLPCVANSQVFTKDYLLKTDPIEFDEFIGKYKQDIFPLDSLKEVVLEMLRQGKFVTDDAIDACVQLVYINDITSNGHELNNVIAFIDCIVGLLFKRDMLKAKLLSRKLRFISMSNKKDEQITRQIKDTIIHEVLSLSENTIAEFVNIKLYHLLDLALSKEMAGDKKQAEKLYIEVLNYPFWSFNDANLRTKIRGYYTTACLGRIRINCGDLKGLRMIAYVPSVAEDIEPTLRSCVEGLGVSWEKFNEDND